MATLDEKQIQERLYGKYHKETSVNPLKPAAAQKQILFIAPQTSTQNTEPKRSSDLNSILGPLQDSFTRLGKILPWKTAALSGILIVSTVLIGRGVLGWVKNHPKKVKVYETEAPVVRKISSPVLSEPSSHFQKTASVPAVAPIGNTSSSAAVEFTGQQKFFAVQICTYQREQDARKLVEKLTRMNFPAFYKLIASRGERIPLFVVFLNRSESYSQAKNQLEQFRKTDLFREFSDSFIRSL